MGRPTKLTDEVEKAICDALMDGATYRAAAEAAGIAYETFNEWMKDTRPRFVKFSDSIRQVNAKARTELVRQIKQHGRKDWRALAWILERRFADEYQPQSKTDITSGGKSIDELINDELSRIKREAENQVAQRIAAGEDNAANTPQ